MSLFRVYVDGALFYHPQMSKLAITDARIEEDAENIDSMTLSAPFNHPYHVFQQYPYHLRHGEPRRHLYMERPVLPAD